MALAILHTLNFFIGLLVVVAILGLICLLVFMAGKGHFDWMNRWLSRLPERIVVYIAYIAIGIIGIYAVNIGGLVLSFCVYFCVYLPLSSLMELGYTLPVAIGLYVGILALLPVPLYCMGGKKLLLNTKWGEKICPVVPVVR